MSKTLTWESLSSKILKMCHLLETFNYYDVSLSKSVKPDMPMEVGHKATSYVENSELLVDETMGLRQPCASDRSRFCFTVLAAGAQTPGFVTSHGQEHRQHSSASSERVDTCLSLSSDFTIVPMTKHL